MANNPFTDFSALKSLKKELEKQDAPKNPAKPANEPRKKTVTHKSKEDILGDRKARETGLQPGMRVTLMDSTDRGVIKRVRKAEEIDLHLESLWRRGDCSDNQIVQNMKSFGPKAWVLPQPVLITFDP